MKAVQSGLIDGFCHLKLGIKISRIDIAWKIGGTKILPSVLVHLPSVIFAPVRTLFPQDLCLFYIFRIPDQNSAPFSHAEVFRFMKAEASKISYGSQGFPLVGTHDSLCRILYHLQMMPPCNIHDHIHLTGNSRIMNHCYGLCFLRNGRLDQRLVNIHGIRPDIYKHRRGPPQYKSVCRGNKGIRGHDHFIALLDIA